jgi:precorrin-8X/cobalt-precorrin-8 methylmutase
MKSLLLCILNNRLELELVRRLRGVMSHRLGDCEVREVVVRAIKTPAEIAEMCVRAFESGYDRVYVQAATLAYTAETYKSISRSLDDLRRDVPGIPLTIFPPLQLHETCADTIERNVYHAVLADSTFTATPPDEIQPRSFEIIRARLGDDYLDSDAEPVIVRVVHATADFSVAPLLRFSPDAVSRATEALKGGCQVITDVGMVSAGLTTRFRERTICAVTQPGVGECAAQKGLTRSAAGIELLADRIDGAIVVIGNAPTALVHLLSVAQRTGARPACVVGVPVGFVGAAESKELLMASDLPYVSMKGNRGGTPVAVAAVNAMASP